MLRTQRYSGFGSHSGSPSSSYSGSYSGSYQKGGLLSPYASPRHSHKVKRVTNAAVLALEVGLLLLFMLAVWKYYTSTPPATGVPMLEPDCPDCGHKRAPKLAANHPASDLSIKLARGRKDLYTANGSAAAQQQPSRTAREPASNNSVNNTSTPATLVEAEQQLQNKSSTREPAPGQQPQQQPEPQQPEPPQTQQEPQPQPQQQHQAQVTETQPDNSIIAVQDASADAAQTQQTATAAAAGASSSSSSSSSSGASSSGARQVDPLHDDQFALEKEVQQLAAMSRMVQQQQDTITRQATALRDLQRRFVQQEHQLQAATAGAASSNSSGSDTAKSEPYFPEEKVKQELNMLHQVEAQIEEVAAVVSAASAALPQLSRDQQTKQIAELARADQLMNRLSKVAAAISLRTSDPLTQGGQDPVAELRHYYGTVANTVTTSWKDALSRQSRPTAASLGLEDEPYSDPETDLDTLHVRLEYALEVMKAAQKRTPCQIALVTTWSGDLWGLRRELVPWLTYHAQLGVSKLFVLYEGGDKNTLTELNGMSPFVTVMLASAPLATAAQVGAYNAWVATVPDAHIKEWRAQPGNYQLMTKQGFASTKALELARLANMTWLIHMDPDELLHPGAAPQAGDLGGAFSLVPELCSAPSWVPSIRFVNVEGVPEAADLMNRYEQVTLFRAHRHLVPPATQPFRYIFKQGHAQAWLHLYTNGKSAVRPDAPGVAQGGPHIFLGPADPRWVTSDNPYGIWHPVISNSTLVLHYAYATPGDVAVKAGRSCPPAVVEQVLAGNASQVSKCFVLDLDQRAFLAAIQDRKAAGLPMVEPPSNLTAATPADALAVPAEGSGGSRELLVDSEVFNGDMTSSGFSNKSWPAGSNVQDFFWGELVMSEGAPFECLTPDGQTTGWCSMRNVGQLKSLLISSGLMLRLHAPSQLMKGIEETIELMLAKGEAIEALQADVEASHGAVKRLQHLLDETRKAHQQHADGAALGAVASGGTTPAAVPVASGGSAASRVDAAAASAVAAGEAVLPAAETSTGDNALLATPAAAGSMTTGAATPEQHKHLRDKMLVT